MADALRVTADNPVTGRQPPTWQSFATNLAVVRDQPAISDQNSTSRARVGCNVPASWLQSQSQSWLQSQSQSWLRSPASWLQRPGELVATSRRVGCKAPASWSRHARFEVGVGVGARVWNGSAGHDVVMSARVLRVRASKGPRLNPMSKASAQVGRVAIRAVDFVVANRLGDAESLLEKARASLPTAAPGVLANVIVSRVAREMAGMGALSGAVAMAPAVGTVASLATSAADVGVAFGRISTMIMAVGLAHGVDLSSEEVRKQHVYAVLGGAESQLQPNERKAGELKKMLGKQAVGARTTLPAIGRVNDVVASRVGIKVVEKLAAKGLAVRLATLLPMGIGAGVGAVGNRALVTSVGRTAVAYFASQGRTPTTRTPITRTPTTRALPASVADRVKTGADSIRRRIRRPS